MSGGGVGGMMNPPGWMRIPAGVADERDAGVGAVVADVMRRVPWRVGHLELAAAFGDALAAFQHDQR